MADKTEQKQRPAHLFKKGVSGNPKGRPKGSGGGLKDFDRKKFYAMSDEEKDKFLAKLAPELRYRMAEGNPHQTEEHSGELKVLVVPDEVAKELNEDESN